MENKTSRLTALRELTAKKKQAESVLAKTKDLLETEQQNLKRQDITLKKEYEDVLRLEKASLVSVFYSFLGKKEDRLDKEKQEYLAARLKYDGCKETVARLEAELTRLQKELTGLGNPEKEYADLLKTMSEQRKAANDQGFMAISNRMDLVYSKYVEMEEAIDAGKKAADALKIAIEALGKAQGWGTFDMIGGGLIATAVKHSHMDDANRQIREVQFQLRRFKKELDDVGHLGSGQLETDLNGFDRFMDYFFDNLITDWIVQNRINASNDKCVNTRIDIVKIVNSLIAKKSELSTEYKSLKTNLSEYLESS